MLQILTEPKCNSVTKLEDLEDWGKEFIKHLKWVRNRGTEKRLHFPASSHFGKE